MGKNFFIADMHFGHEKIIKMCNRPFENVQDMKDQLIKKWNNKVNDDDIVYILGDFSFKCSKEETIEILNQLKGKKVLLKGNHDKYVGQKDFDNCFEKICDILQVNEDKLQIILCHYPIIDYPGMYYGAKMIYGHIHNKYIPHRDMYCASVECINYEPVTWDELEHIYAEKEVEDTIDWSYKI